MVFLQKFLDIFKYSPKNNYTFSIDTNSNNIETKDEVRKKYF